MFSWMYHPHYFSTEAQLLVFEQLWYIWLFLTFKRYTAKKSCSCFIKLNLSKAVKDVIQKQLHWVYSAAFYWINVL